VPKVRVAVAGVGNCASALVQGVEFYSKHPDESLGLIARELGGHGPADVEFVAAFDVSEGKVGRDLAEAIWAPPNNTLKLAEVPRSGIKVSRGPVLDGVGKYLRDVVRLADSPEVDVATVLRDSGADVLVNYLPVGSASATHHYAAAAIRAGVGFVNAMPVFIASDSDWQGKFRDAGLPVAGDDVMSQLGATVLHKTLVKLCIDRGVRVEETYQLNIGGDADFLNMLEEARLADKRESKTSAVRAMAPYPIPTRIGPSDYVEFLENDKVCYIWLKGRYFAGAPVTVELKLHVVDAFNSAGIMIDAVRAMKIARKRNIAGPLVSVSAYCFKHPPLQMAYNDAKHALLEFVKGARSN
jgi:myo-inositol-1-phosphate synthase